MPQNTEIKARVTDLDALKKLAAALSDEEGTVLEQEDTFYHSPKGYLKLRIIKGDKNQLVYYERPAVEGPKISHYHVTVVEDPAPLKATLEAVCGVRGVVKKHRTLYMVGQTRVHCDRVEGLGDHMELEVVMKEGQTPEEGESIAKDLMMKLNVGEDDLMTGAYLDHLQKNNAEEKTAEDKEPEAE